MPISTKLYTISFVDLQTQNPIKTPISDFFKKIEEVLNKGVKEEILKNIKNKTMRVHAFEWESVPSQPNVVIPFGILKTENKPYANDPKTNKISQFKDDMFDINYIAYHPRYQVLSATTFRNGPTTSHIEDYLNSFLSDKSNVKIEIIPIKKEQGIEAIRNANEATKLIIDLDISKSVTKFLKQELYEDESILNSFQSLITKSKKELNSKTFKLELGLGHKRGSLSVSALVTLIDSLNLNEDCIKQITVKYKNKNDEKFDFAKLKDAETTAKVEFPVDSKDLTSEFLLDNMEDILSSFRTQYYTSVNDYFSNIKEQPNSYDFIN